MQGACVGKPLEADGNNVLGWTGRWGKFAGVLRRWDLLLGRASARLQAFLCRLLGDVRVFCNPHLLAFAWISAPFPKTCRSRSQAVQLCTKGSSFAMEFDPGPCCSRAIKPSQLINCSAGDTVKLRVPFPYPISPFPRLGRLYLERLQDWRSATSWERYYLREVHPGWSL